MDYEGTWEEKYFCPPCGIEFFVPSTEEGNDGKNTS